MMADCTSTPNRLRHVGTQLFGRYWQNALARALGVSRHTLYRWLRGERTPPADLDARLMSITTAAAAGAARLTSEIASK